MPSPFPGRNPWMEASELWPGVHASLISEIRTQLNAIMPSRYFADVEERVYLCDVDDQSIVTVIEILSPANKLQGSAGRSCYLSKRPEVLSSETHLIEIDLLRAGSRTEPSRGMAHSDYLVWLSRTQDRSVVDYWPTPLESPLPTIPVPLLPGDPDVPLNLQAILHDVYDHSGYVRRLNYALPAPPPPISDTHMEWLRGFLKSPKT